MSPTTSEDELVRACRRGLGAAPPDVDPTPDGARGVIGWLVERVARARYTPEAFRATYCARTPLAVLSDARLPFTAPCADLSGIAAALLVRAGIPTTLVLTGISRSLRSVKFQCGLELDFDGDTWVLGFGVSGTSLYRGRFEPTPGRPWIYRRRPAEVSLEVSFLTHFDRAGREGVANLVPGYDLAGDLTSHVRRSGRLLFELARRRARARFARPRATNLVAELPFTR